MGVLIVGPLKVYSAIITLGGPSVTTNLNFRRVRTYNVSLNFATRCGMPKQWQIVPSGLAKREKCTMHDEK